MYCRCINNGFAPGHFAIGVVYQWYWNRDEDAASLMMTWPIMNRLIEREKFLSSFKIIEKNDDTEEYPYLLLCICKTRNDRRDNFTEGRVYQCHASADCEKVRVFPDNCSDEPVTLDGKSFLNNFELLSRLDQNPI